MTPMQHHGIPGATMEAPPGLRGDGAAPGAGGENSVYLTLSLAGTPCGLPVMAVRDVIAAQAITRIPLAPPSVAGSLNLRGRIVTVIELRRRLGLPPRPEGAPAMHVVVEHDGEPYGLLVDQVGEVAALPVAGHAAMPPTLDPLWREAAAGVHRRDDGLLVLLDVARLLAIGEA